MTLEGGHTLFCRARRAGSLSTAPHPPTLPAARHWRDLEQTPVHTGEQCVREEQFLETLLTSFDSKDSGTMQLGTKTFICKGCRECGKAEPSRREPSVCAGS